MPIQDIQTFSKLFKLPIPLHREVDYYLQTLARSAQFEDMATLRAEFESFEARLQQRQMGAAQYRNQCNERLVKFIGATEAYKRFEDAPLPARPSRKDDRRRFHGQVWLSIDLRKANYHTLRRFDDDGELGQSWEALLEEQGVDRALSHSKSFRQIIFGNLNPKRSQRLQSAIIADMLHGLIGGGQMVQDEVVFIGHDELIVACGQGPEAAERCAAIGQAAQALEALPAPHTMRLTVLRHSALAGRGCALEEHLDPNTLDVTQRRLFGVPGNLFFLYFKQHVLQEPLDVRDRYFWNEGRLAMWVDEEGL